MNRYLAAFAVVSTFSSALAQAQPVDLVLRLSPRLPVAELAANVTDPSSPRYGKFYTPEEIRAVAGPSDEQYAQLLSQLRADGFSVVSESKTHLTLTVRADHAKLEQLFSVRMNFSANSRVRSASAAPTIPAKYSSLVESVTGLDNTHRLKPHLVFAPKVAKNDGSGTQPGYLPAQIKTAYKLNDIYTDGKGATGQHIAIATYMGFYIQDVQDYYTKEALSPMPTVDQVQFNGTPALDDASAAETQLDAEFAGMMAPGAAVHVFASAENSDAGETALYTAILDDNRAKVVNYSWGDCETHIAAAHQADMDKLYAQAVAQGVNVLAASGDSGTDGCNDGTIAADWPASVPNVVAIGGTSLNLGTDGSVQSETGWSGSGGGISKFYKAPSWQASVVPASYSAGRAYPDVAFNADPMTGEAIWTHYQNTQAYWVPLGGTSMAAPQWTGFLTMVNAGRAAKGLGSLPFLPTLLYPLSGAQLANVLTDITSGNNGEFTAAAGFDGVTGLGTPQGKALYDLLVSSK